MKETQLSLNLEYGISKEQACILCHLSSECEGCCVKCKAENKNDGCSGQACSQPFRENEGNRWDTWMYIVSTSLPELKRFIPVKYRKHLKTKK